MNKYLEIHTLHNVPLNLMNADRNGNPKSQMYGGYRRDYFSSQSVKRSVKEICKEEMPTVFNGISTTVKSFIINAMDKIDNLNEKQATNILKSYVGDSIDKVTFQFCNYECTMFMDILQKVTNNEITEKEAKQEAKSIESIVNCINIKLFGRMNASNLSQNVDGVSMVSSTTCTGKSPSQYDYFTVKDELSKDKGAIHINERQFSTGCYYRVYIIDMNSFLSQNDTFTKDQLLKALKIFIKEMTIGLPKGKQNTMFSSVLPSCIFAIKTNNQPKSMMNAFEKPCANYQKSYDALVNELDYSKNFREDSVIKEYSQKNNSGTFSNFIVDLLKEYK